MTNHLWEIWNLTGTRIYGGCDHCLAYRTEYTVAGITYTKTHHHPTCPWMRERNQQRAEGNK